MHQQPFIITGLPRSRTAWLAEVATIDNWSYCGHEPKLGWTGLNDLRDYFQSRDDHYVGVSDSHLSQVLPDILSVYPIKTLVVLRDYKEVSNSLQSRGLNSDILPIYLDGILSVSNNPLVQTIEYKQLSNSYKVRKALQWVMPDADISLKRIQYLQNQIIEANHEANREMWQSRNKHAISI